MGVIFTQKIFHLEYLLSFWLLLVMNNYQTYLHWKEEMCSHGNMDRMLDYPSNVFQLLLGTLRSTLGHCQEDTITQLMLINVLFFYFHIFMLRYLYFNLCE